MDHKHLQYENHSFSIWKAQFNPSSSLSHLPPHTHIFYLEGEKLKRLDPVSNSLTEPKEVRIIEMKKGAKRLFPSLPLD